MLGHFGQEIQGAEDLEAAARFAEKTGTGRPGKTAAVLFLGMADHRAAVGHADDPR